VIVFELPFSEAPKLGGDCKPVRAHGLVAEIADRSSDRFIFVCADNEVVAANDVTLSHNLVGQPSRRAL
jgi:hypothetical protein